MPLSVLNGNARVTRAEWGIPIFCGTCTGCGVRRGESEENKERYRKTRREAAEEQRRRNQTYEFQVQMQMALLTRELGEGSEELDELRDRIRTLPPAGQHDVLVATLIAVRAQQAREHVP